MMRSLTLFSILNAILILAAAPAYAASGAPPLNQGPMIHLTDRRWDFGELPQHTKVTHSLEVSNEGTEPLRLIKVQPDCGCTAALPQDSTLAPGATTTIKITFDSESYEGFQQKIITVLTNDPAEPRIDVVFTADVKPYIEVEKRTLDFSQVRRGQLPVLTDRFSSLEGPFKVEPPKDAVDWITWKVTPAAADKGTAYQLEARLRPDAPFGPFNERVEVPVVHPRKTPYERIFVKGYVYSYFVTDEQRIDFPTLKGGQSANRIVKISGDGSKPYTITGVKADFPYITPTLEQKGKEYVLKVSVVAPSGPLALKTRISLTTTDPAQPDMEIPLRIRIAP
jgi:hypothetical protein